MQMNRQSDPLWTPTPDERAGANMTSFQAFVESTQDRTFSNYEDLWLWSITELEVFWSSVWEFFGVGDARAYERVLASESMPGAQWFPGATVNFAAFLLEQGEDEDVAIISVDERGGSRSLTRGELREQVSRVASALRHAGVGLGDRVVGYLPNTGEAVVAFLATAWLGAIWSSVGQDYAAPAVVDRFAQLQPTVLIAADGYWFGGRQHDRVEAVREIQAGLPSLTHTIMVSRLGAPISEDSWGTWAETLSHSPSLAPELLPFSHPLWILFSSGTTGLPKGLVHGHGGILVETLKQMSLHWNLKNDDRLLWYTSPSWVMWNLQVSALATGGSIVCYDGSPTSPDPSALWKLVADLGVTFFGSSPGFLQASQNASVHPSQQFNLSRLRAMGSTGSPLSPHSHRWAAREVGPIPLYSISGGTDVAGAFCGGSPTVPIWPGELSVRCLGVAIEAWNEEGCAVYDEVGELVIRRPMPSMPVSFWDDPEDRRYRAAYFAEFEGVWRQGDWITVTARGTVIVHGRSDSTLNRNGVRMGSADIYSAVEDFTEVAEALVIGAEMPDGSYWMPLFLVLEGERVLDRRLAESIKVAIGTKASPRHIPDEIIQVVAIPHTRTGKKLEVPIKRLLQGEAISKVANPDAVDDASLLGVFADIAAQHSVRGDKGFAPVWTPSKAAPASVIAVDPSARSTNSQECCPRPKTSGPQNENGI